MINAPIEPNIKPLKGKEEDKSLMLIIIKSTVEIKIVNNTT